MNVCMWSHLGAGDSLGGSFYVGRQTKECRLVIFWETVYYTAVVLERHTDGEINSDKDTVSLAKSCFLASTQCV